MRWVGLGCPAQPQQTLLAFRLCSAHGTGGKAGASLPGTSPHLLPQGGLVSSPGGNMAGLGRARGAASGPPLDTALGSSYPLGPDWPSALGPLGPPIPNWARKVGEWLLLVPDWPAPLGYSWAQGSDWPVLLGLKGAQSLLGKATCFQLLLDSDWPSAPRFQLPLGPDWSRALVFQRLLISDWPDARVPVTAAP